MKTPISTIQGAMLTTELPPTAPAGSQIRIGGSHWAVIAAATAVTAAYLLPLARHMVWLWQRPHYQFFPFVLLGAGVLAYSRLRKRIPGQPGETAVSVLGITAAWMLAAAAELLGSPWLGCVSFLVLAIAAAYAIGGRSLVRTIAPAWALLWFLVPPPLDIDRALIFALQDLTTGWSSAVLDVLGVFHIRAGNVIEADGRRLLVEQACSGINSLFSLLACTLFLVFLTRRSWGRGIALLAATIGWVLAANVVRVVAVVVLATRWQIDVATGWRHEVLGLLLFATAAGLLLSTDRLLTFLTSRPDQTPPPPIPPVERTTAAASPGLRPLALAATVAFSLLAFGYWTAADAGTRETASIPPELERVSPPTNVNGWTVYDTTVRTRETFSYFGERSRVWVYGRGGAHLVLSLDYPFPGWHDLTWCYTGQGWRVDTQDVREEEGIVAARLTQSPNRHGYLVFSEFDARGQLLAPRAGGTGTSLFRHQLTLARLGLGNGDQDPPGPVFQFQAFVEDTFPLTPDDEANVRAVFIPARQSLRDVLIGR